MVQPAGLAFRRAGRMGLQRGQQGALTCPPSVGSRGHSRARPGPRAAALPTLEEAHMPLGVKFIFRPMAHHPPCRQSPPPPPCALASPGALRAAAAWGGAEPTKPHNRSLWGCRTRLAARYPHRRQRALTAAVEPAFQGHWLDCMRACADLSTCLCARRMIQARRHPTEPMLLLTNPPGQTKSRP